MMNRIPVWTIRSTSRSARPAPPPEKIPARIGGAPFEVRFADQSQGSSMVWTWDFGDGAGSVLRNPNHTFMDPGTYQVTLTVSNMKGRNSAFKIVFVW